MTRWRNNAVSSSRRSGDSTPLTTTLRAMVCSCASSSADSSRPVNTTTGMSAEPASSRMRSNTSKPDMSGSRRSSTTQSTRSSRSIGERLGAGFDRDDVDVVVAEQLGDAQLLGGIVLDHQQALAARLRVFLDAVSACLEPFRGRRLGDEGEGAARQPVLTVLVQGHDLHRDVPRQRVLLQLAQHRPAQHVGQEHVERDGASADIRAPAPARRRRASRSAP